MWDERRTKLVIGGDISPHDVELMSMLERTLNYAHTGSGRVLTRTLMDRSFLSLGIINDGFPVINMDFMDFNQIVYRKVVVLTDHWPVDKQTKAPLICSRRCQHLTYSEGYAQVCTCFITLVLRRFMIDVVCECANISFLLFAHHTSHIILVSCGSYAQICHVMNLRISTQLISIDRGSIPVSVVNMVRTATRFVRRSS